MTMPGRGNIPHEYGFSCWDLRLERVGAGGPRLGAGERISRDQPLGLLGPGILMHPLHQDQGRRSGEKPSTCIWRSLQVVVQCQALPGPSKSNQFSRALAALRVSLAGTCQAVIPGAPPSSVPAGWLPSLVGLRPLQGGLSPPPGLQAGRGHTWPLSHLSLPTLFWEGTFDLAGSKTGH